MNEGATPAPPAPFDKIIADSWTAQLATVIAIALRDLGDANPHYAKRILRDNLDAFLERSGCSDELAASLREIAP